jgi:hypothetical protein
MTSRHTPASSGLSTLLQLIQLDGIHHLHQPLHDALFSSIDIRTSLA